MGNLAPGTENRGGRTQLKELEGEEAGKTLRTTTLSDSLFHFLLSLEPCNAYSILFRRSGLLCLGNDFLRGGVSKCSPDPQNERP
jgi:hypothetical protein